MSKSAAKAAAKALASALGATTPTAPSKAKRPFYLRAARGLHRAFLWLFHPRVMVAIGLLILGDAWLEIQGLPDWAVRRIERSMANNGIHARIRSVSAGFAVGVVIEDLTVFDGDSQWPLAKVGKLKLNVAEGRLLIGTLKIKHVDFERLALYLPQNPAAPTPALKLLAGRVSGSIHLRDEQLYVESLEGSLGGVRVHAQGRLSGLVPNQSQKAGDISWKALLDRLSEEEKAKIALFMREVYKSGVPLADGWLDLAFDLPLQDLAAGDLNGTLNLNGMSLYGVDIASLRSRFGLADRKLALNQLFIQFFSGQNITADLELDLPTQLLSGTVAGNAKPAELLPLLNLSVPDALRDVTFYSPLQFRAEMAPSPWRDPAAWQLSATLQANHARLHDMEAARIQISAQLAPGWQGTGGLEMDGLNMGASRLESVRAKLVFNKKEVTASEFQIRFGTPLQESIGGTVLWKRPEQTIEATLSGTLMPHTLLALVPGVNPQFLASCREFTATKNAPAVKLQIDPSPDRDLSAWKGRCEIGLDNTRFRDAVFNTGHVVAQYDQGQLALELALANPPKEFDLRASFAVDTRKGRMQGQAKGSLHADSALADLKLNGSHIASRLHQPDAPLFFDLHLDDSPLNPAEWTGGGVLRTKHALYEDLDLRDAASNEFSFKPGNITFGGIDGKAGDGDIWKGCVSVALPSGDVDITADIYGDPRRARVFVPSGSSRDIYDKIWQDIVWSPEHRPHVVLNELRYISLEDNEWKFLLKGTLDADGANWRSIKTERFSTELDLSLPESLRIVRANAQHGDNILDGKAFFTFVDSPMCQFSLTGSFDPRLLFRALNEKWDTYFEQIRFGDNTRFTCNGYFDFATEPRPVIRGTLESNTCWYDRLRFDNLSARWLLNDQRLSWQPLIATLYDGKVLSSGNFDFGAEFGDIILNGSKIRLGDMLAALNDKLTKNQGELTANCHLSLYRLRPDADLSIIGTGNLWISDADLWNVPVLGSLGRVVGLSSFGRITKLNTDLVFAEDHIQIEDFKTDGTILSLSGSGNYKWNSREIAMYVRGTTLEKTRIVPWLLSPFFSMFEAELSGTIDAPKWQMGRKSKATVP